MEKTVEVDFGGRLAEAKFVDRPNRFLALAEARRAGVRVTARRRQVGLTGLTLGAAIPVA